MGAAYQGLWKLTVTQGVRVLSILARSPFSQSHCWLSSV